MVHCESDRVSHKIVSLRESGDNFIGKAKILGTPMGKIAANLVEEGVKLGVSSRGIGSLKTTKEGCNIVGDDFMLATAADIVADPSAPDAFVEGIMEGKEWVWEGGLLREKYAEQPREKSTHSSVRERWRSINSNCGMISYLIFNFINKYSFNTRQ